MSKAKPRNIKHKIKKQKEKHIELYKYKEPNLLNYGGETQG